MKHILVIRLSAMGDVAMTVPVIRALTQQNDSIKITFLTRSFFSPFFNEFSNVSIFSPDLKGRHKGLLGLFKLFKDLSKLKIDVVADLHNVLRSNIVVGLFKLTGTPCVQLNKGRKEKKELTKPVIGKSLLPLNPMHNRYVDVFKKLGFILDLTKKIFPEKSEIPSSIFNQLKGKKLIGLAPFATYKSKSLPIKNIKELIHQINLKTDATVLLFGGGEKEKLILEGIADDSENVISLVKKISFEDELKLISNLDVMIAMDSGNGHIAAMYGIPVITIWGMTHPSLGFSPFNQPFKNQILPDLKKYPLIPTSVYGNKYPQEYLTCFDTISINGIVKLLNEYL
ncbi:ADP-heptose:LPS heptosyltransferase [Tenacibaculum adriaticum]|uniref:ADP-heptose:LPS heptosyltransferase n=1 Tax=Tenacibaculum adriaticum TaxID=413713 RepID=A0A5S5DUN0_9FLAO|nr:glycosyltransferase family 9 protein [Tenacibaculum adriaticum]TYP99617.1 ADP-heptose:LPS heptosyltransferase [Tenacibaculum adriaticum]